MRLYLPIAGALLIVVASGQEMKNNCSIDPDLISFEDKDLEAVMKSLYSSGNCSAIVWKKEVVNVLKKHKKEIVEMSTQDKSMLRYLISFVVKPEAERPPPDYFLYLGTLSESEIMNPLDFGPSSKSPTEVQDDATTIDPILWKFGSNQETDSSTSAARSKRQLQRFPEIVRSPRTGRPWSPGPEVFPLGLDDEFEKSPMFGRNTPRTIGEEKPNYHHPNKNRGFGNEMGQNQWGPERRLNNDFMRPSSQQKPETLWASRPRNPVEYRPRDEYENFLNRPRPLGRPGDNFFRPPSKPSTPKSPRRPFADGGSVRPGTPQLGDPDIISPEGNFFRPFGKPSTPEPQRRHFTIGGSVRPETPKLGDPDIVMPDDQRLFGNFDDENSVLGNNIPITTEGTLKTTTRPGPQPWATPASLCVRTCPNTPEFNPVCGSDSVTYSNPGRLRCEQMCGKAAVSLNYYGTCVTTTTAFSIPTL